MIIIATKIININRIPYEELKKQHYLLISEDYGYDENGKYYVSNCSRLSYIDKVNGISESIWYSFHSSIREKALKEAQKRGLDFIYISRA